MILVIEFCVVLTNIHQIVNFFFLLSYYTFRQHDVCTYRSKLKKILLRKQYSIILMNFLQVFEYKCRIRMFENVLNIIQFKSHGCHNYLHVWLGSSAYCNKITKTIQIIFH